MKIERRIRKYKTLIEEVCEELQLQIPSYVFQMKNYAGRVEKTFCRIEANSQVGSYKLYIRTHKYKEEELHRIPQDTLKKMIYNKLTKVFNVNRSDLCDSNTVMGTTKNENHN